MTGASCTNSFELHAGALRPDLGGCIVGLWQGETPVLRFEEPAVLATRKAAQPGIDAQVAPLEFDPCFNRWTCSARIRDEKLSLQRTSSLSRRVVCKPAKKDYFCDEPVSHAIHRADPAAHRLQTVLPGETFSAHMALTVGVV